MSEAMNDLEMQERFQKYLDLCKRTIQEHGYIVQGVYADEDTPSYTYTIGLVNKNTPDYIQFDMISDSLIAEVVESENLELDKIYESGCYYCILPNGDKVPTRYMVKSIPVTRFEEYASGAFNPKIIDRPPCCARQIILADLNNLLPGEEGYTPLPTTPQLWI